MTGDYNELVSRLAHQRTMNPRVQRPAPALVKRPAYVRTPEEQAQMDQIGREIERVRAERGSSSDDLAKQEKRA